MKCTFYLELSPNKLKINKDVYWRWEMHLPSLTNQNLFLFNLMIGPGFYTKFCCVLDL